MLAYTFYESDNRVRRYAEALVKRGDEVDAIALRRAGQARFEVIRGVRVHRIQKRVRNEQHPAGYLIKLLMFLLLSAWTVTRFHWRAHYDLIHVHSVPDFAVFATAIPRLMGARVILDIHDIVPEFYAAKFHITPRSIIFRLLVLMERLSAWYSHHVIIANHIWHARLIQRSVRPEKCTVILNYPDPEIFYPRERKEAERDVFVMCYPGTLNWHQGLDRAISAVAILREKAPNLRLRIIGDGPALETLKAMIKLERLEDRVLITGSVPIEEVAETLASVDLGIVPKRKDSFGNEAFSTKILEFMAMGVPVLAANTRIDQYYFNENLLQFFDSDSVDDLAAKITSLMRDPARRAALRQRASEFIRLNNWHVKGGEYLELVDRLVKRQKDATVAETLTT
jgi:glycosyltransferase involved in cell wall biosynthesis